jgi:hypothetical protein
MKSLKFLLPCILASSCVAIPLVQNTLNHSKLSPIETKQVLNTAFNVSCVVSISSIQEFFYMGFDMEPTDLLYFVPDEPDMDCLTTKVLNSIANQTGGSLIIEESQLVIYGNGVSLLDFDHEGTLQEVCQFLSVAGINLIT